MLSVTDLSTTDGLVHYHAQIEHNDALQITPETHPAISVKDRAARCLHSNTLRDPPKLICS